MYKLSSIDRKILLAILKIKYKPKKYGETPSDAWVQDVARLLHMSLVKLYEYLEKLEKQHLVELDGETISLTKSGINKISDK